MSNHTKDERPPVLSTDDIPDWEEYCRRTDEPEEDEPIPLTRDDGRHHVGPKRLWSTIGRFMRVGFGFAN